MNLNQIREPTDVSPRSRSARFLLAAGACLAAAGNLSGQRLPSAIAGVDTIANLELGVVMSGGVAPDGSLLLIDMPGTRVLKLSPTGRFVRAFGRGGDGPGEFRLASRVAAMPDGRIVVFDVGNRQFSWFTGDGRFLRRRQTPVAFRNIDAMAGLADGSLVVAAHVPYGSGAGYSIHVLNDSLGHVRSFGPVPPTTSPLARESWGVGGVTMAADGALLFSLRTPHVLYTFTPTGAMRSRAEVPGPRLTAPEDAVIPILDAAGNVKGKRRRPNVEHPVVAWQLSTQRLLTGLVGGPSPRWQIVDSSGRVLEAATYPAGYGGVLALDGSRKILWLYGAINDEPALFRGTLK